MDESTFKPFDSEKCNFTWKKNQKINASPLVDLENMVSTHSNFSTHSSHSHKKKHSLTASQKISQSNDYKAVGSDLASDGKFIEAIENLDKAAALSPEDETIYEMKAQVLMILEKDFLAVKCAEIAVSKNECWWIGWMTLGRAQMNLKDFYLATKSFSRSIHLHPYESEELLHDFRSAADMKKKSQSMEDS